MHKTRRRLAYALCISVAAITGLLGAPAAFADDGHQGGGHGGRDGDEHHAVVDDANEHLNQNQDMNEDVDDDNGIDAPQVHLEDIFDDND